MNQFEKICKWNSLARTGLLLTNQLIDQSTIQPINESTNQLILKSIIWHIKCSRLVAMELVAMELVAMELIALEIEIFHSKKK